MAPLIPPVKPGGRPAVHPRRELVNALAYWARSGLRLAAAPARPAALADRLHDWRVWRREGRWEQILSVLRAREQVRQGRDPTQSAGIIDSQSVRITDRGLARR